MVFDIRKFGNSKNPRSASKPPKTVAMKHFGGSINSSFFSPSGSHLLTTSTDDVLTITPASALQGELGGKESQSLKHDNHTGRWLATFMARWHPSHDVFVVGCMKQPRRVEIFGADGKGRFGIKAECKGDVVSAVCSRNVFHRTERRAAGGNSSGRVVLF